MAISSKSSEVDLTFPYEEAGGQVIQHVLEDGTSLPGSVMPKELAELLSPGAIQAADLALAEGVQKGESLSYAEYMAAMRKKGFSGDTANMVLHRATSLGQYSLCGLAEIVLVPQGDK